MFDRYPELAERIERGKRAKIDAIVLSNKYADGDGLFGSFRSQSLEEMTTSPLRQRTRRRASKEASRIEPNSPALTPQLKDRSSVQDLMFEMSDGDGDNDVDTLEKIKQPKFRDSSSELKDSESKSPRAPWSSVSRQGQLSPHSLGDGENLSVKPIAFPSPPVQQTRTLDRPWGTTPLASAKLDLKDIMKQTSSDKPSNLTLGLSRSESDQKSAIASHSKMSQKERKRLQQARQLGVSVETPQPAPPVVSPWQAASHRKASNAPVVPPTQPSTVPSPQPPRASSTPQLTMRQTVAKKGSATQQDKSSHRQPSQSTPGPASPAQNRPAASERGMSVSTTPIPTPRSVRHIPKPSHSPTSPSQHLSMMEILSLQEAEKVSIRDAAAKRSLQEIQQEQEFQAWWDQESKRAMREEEQVRRAQERSCKAAAGAGTRGRGKGRGGGRGGAGVKGKKKDGEGEVSVGPSKKEGNALKEDGGEKGRGRGRGGRIGRGGARGGHKKDNMVVVAAQTSSSQA